MYGDEGDEYGQEEREYFAVPDLNVEFVPPGVPLTPTVQDKPFKGNPVPSRLTLATLRHSTRFGGLGDFSAAGVCAVNALAKLLWRFYSQVNDGMTLDALTTLNVYRSLYNLKRSVIATGYAPALAAGLPASLPAAEWSADMRSSSELVLVGALGMSDANIMATVRAMPTSMAQLPNWWTGFARGASLNASDLAALRTYIEVPMPVGQDPSRILAAYVADDIRTCAAGAPAPAPTPTPAPGVYTAQPTSPQQVAQTMRCADGTIVPAGTPCPPSGGGGGGGATPGPVPGGSSSGGATPSSGVGFMGIALGAIALYGLYLAVQDGKKTPAELRGEVDGDLMTALRQFVDKRPAGGQPAQVTPHLQALEAAGLIQYSRMQNHFWLTPKGKAALRGDADDDMQKLEELDGDDEPEETPA